MIRVIDFDSLFIFLNASLQVCKFASLIDTSEALSLPPAHADAYRMLHIYKYRIVQIKKS